MVTSETPVINTTDYKIDGVVNRKQIDNLPLNGRNFLQLALLEPGVSVEVRATSWHQPEQLFPRFDRRRFAGDDAYFS